MPSSEAKCRGGAHVVGPGGGVGAPNTQLQPDVLVFPATFKPDTDRRKIKEHLARRRGSEPIIKDL